MWIVLTIALSFACGYLLLRLKVPGGMLVGAIVGAAALNVITGKAFLWPQIRFVAQAFTGAYIGCMMSRKELNKLPGVIGPYLTVMSGFLCLNLAVGFLIYKITGLDLLTSLLCAMPGGMTDTPLIALDMGANASAVAVMQFVRMLFGMAILPSIIVLADRSASKAGERASSAPDAAAHASRSAVKKKEPPLLPFLPTLCLAVLFGFLGKKTGIPAGAMSFSMIAVSVLKIMDKTPPMPLYLRRAAQTIAGCCIGTTINAGQLRLLPELAVPAFIVCLSFLFHCLAVGTLISRCFHTERKESMLFVTPAGAAEMSLTAADIGVTSTNLAVLQICRLVGVMLLFPQIFRLIVHYFPF